METTETPIEETPQAPLGDTAAAPAEEAEAPKEAPKRRGRKKKEEQDVIDILKPKSEPKVWVIGPTGGRQLEYVQRELSFIGKMQWFALVGEVVERATSGPEGVSVSSIFGGDFGFSQFGDPDSLIKLIGKLLFYAPDFLIQSYCIWLNVPDHERPLAAELMSQPATQGGLSDQQAVEMIEVFIDQNYEALDTFFRKLLGQLQKRVQARMAEAAEGRQ